MRCFHPPYSGRYIDGRSVGRSVARLVHMSYLYYKSPNLKSLVCNARQQPLIMAIVTPAEFHHHAPVSLSVRQYDKILD